MKTLTSIIANLITSTPLQYLPVYVRDGLAQGARWTLLPFSSNWRSGGEPDLEAAFRMPRTDRILNCWDLGAHFGIHAIGLARQVGPAGQVAAFEPDPVAFTRLSRHVSMNGLKNVKLFNAAVSDRSGNADLIISSGLGSTLSHFKYEDEPVTSSTQSLSVPTVVLDELVDAGEISLPDLIKIDIQGHGAKAIHGGIRAITRSRPIIVLSSHSQWELYDSKAILESLEYQPFDASGNRIPWEAFMHETAILKAGNS